MFNNTSLRTKAITFAIALGTVPVLGIGVMFYQFTTNNITKYEVQSQEIYADNLTDNVNRFLLDRYADIQAIANLTILTNPQKTAGISLQEKQKVLNKYLSTYKVYDSIAVLDMNGNVILQSSGKPLSNHKSREYFQQVLQTGQPVISNIDKSKSTGELVVHFAAPVKDVATGTMIAVVRSRMPVKFLEKVIANFGTDGREWHLVENSSGKFFASSEKKQIERDAKSDIPILAQMQAASKVHTAVAVNQMDKAEQLITYAPFKKLEGLPELKWSVILANDTAKVFAPQRNVLIALLLGTGVTALLASGLAVLFANRTTKFIKGIASAIASSSTEIAATVEQQERTVSQQASSVSQTTTTMDELGASSRQSAEQAEASAAGARQALNLAEVGTKSVQGTMEGMSTLKEKVGAIAEQILRLSEQTNQIGNVSGLVGDLANQTNMLALNAAVEAARAGEHGKGFGVVAGEIRLLADRSKKSAEKINALVTDIQAAINTTVMVTDEGTKKVDQGIKLAEGTAEIFTGVADAIDNVFLNSQQISISAKQQALAIHQVVDAMNAINLGAKESASGITQVKATTQQLNDAAQNLKAMV
jgi:hypothetical protein